MKDFLEFIKDNKNRTNDINPFDAITTFEYIDSIQECLTQSNELTDDMKIKIDIAVKDFLDTYKGGIDEFNDELTSEGFLGTLLGGLTGFALGKAVGEVISKVLGIQKGVLYDLLTSKLVGAALGATIGRRFF